MLDCWSLLLGHWSFTPQPPHSSTRRRQLLRGLHQRIDQLRHAVVVADGAVVEEDAVAEDWVSDGADVVDDRRWAAFEQCAGLGREHQVLAAARAGPKGHIVLHG